MRYKDYPIEVVKDIARLRERLSQSRLPEKVSDRNVLIGTWNIRHFGSVFPDWGDNPGSPKRNYRALASIAEIASRFDVLAIQEVKRDVSGLRLLLDWLGPDWGMIITDVCVGAEGNTERLGFLYDQRRVTPSGLAGEIVLPKSKEGDPVAQFARPPYLVGFRCGEERFVLLTAHIRYGKDDAERAAELRALADFIAKEIRDRSREPGSEEANLIVLGDFNIDERGDNALFQEFISTGLVVPTQLENLRTTFGTKAKYYDQIAWFMGDMNMVLQDAGVIDFARAVWPEITLGSMSFRISDHFPLWACFSADRSEEHMARTAGIDPAMPDPLRMLLEGG